MSGTASSRRPAAGLGRGAAAPRKRAATITKPSTTAKAVGTASAASSQLTASATTTGAVTRRTSRVDEGAGGDRSSHTPPPRRRTACAPALEVSLLQSVTSTTPGSDFLIERHHVLLNNNNNSNNNNSHQNDWDRNPSDSSYIYPYGEGHSWNLGEGSTRPSTPAQHTQGRAAATQPIVTEAWTRAIVHPHDEYLLYTRSMPLSSRGSNPVQHSKTPGGSRRRGSRGGEASTTKGLSATTAAATTQQLEVAARRRQAAAMLAAERNQRERSRVTALRTIPHHGFNGNPPSGNATNNALAATPSTYGGMSALRTTASLARSSVPRGASTASAVATQPTRLSGAGMGTRVVAGTGASSSSMPREGSLPPRPSIDADSVVDEGPDRRLVLTPSPAPSLTTVAATAAAIPSVGDSYTAHTRSPSLQSTLPSQQQQAAMMTTMMAPARSESRHRGPRHQEEGNRAHTRARRAPLLFQSPTPNARLASVLSDSGHGIYGEGPMPREAYSPRTGYHGQLLQRQQQQYHEESEVHPRATEEYERMLGLRVSLLARLANAHGGRVTTEAYPHGAVSGSGAGSTSINRRRDHHPLDTSGSPMEILPAVAVAAKIPAQALASHPDSRPASSLRLPSSFSGRSPAARSGEETHKVGDDGDAAAASRLSVGRRRRPSIAIAVSMDVLRPLSAVAENAAAEERAAQQYGVQQRQGQQQQQQQKPSSTAPEGDLDGVDEATRRLLQDPFFPLTSAESLDRLLLYDKEYLSRKRLSDRLALLSYYAASRSALPPSLLSSPSSNAFFDSLSGGGKELRNHEVREAARSHRDTHQHDPFQDPHEDTRRLRNNHNSSSDAAGGAADGSFEACIARLRAPTDASLPGATVGAGHSLARTAVRESSAASAATKSTGATLSAPACASTATARPIRLQGKNPVRKGKKGVKSASPPPSPPPHLTVSSPRVPPLTPDDVKPASMYHSTAAAAGTTTSVSAQAEASPSSSSSSVMNPLQSVPQRRVSLGGGDKGGGGTDSCRSRSRTNSASPSRSPAHVATVVTNIAANGSNTNTIAGKSYADVGASGSNSLSTVLLVNVVMPTAKTGAVLPINTSYVGYLGRAGTSSSGSGNAGGGSGTSPPRSVAGSTRGSRASSVAALRSPPPLHTASESDREAERRLLDAMENLMGGQPQGPRETPSTANGSRDSTTNSDNTLSAKDFAAFVTRYRRVLLRGGHLLPSSPSPPSTQTRTHSAAARPSTPSVTPTKATGLVGSEAMQWKDTAAEPFLAALRQAIGMIEVTATPPMECTVERDSSAVNRAARPSPSEVADTDDSLTPTSQQLQQQQKSRSRLQRQRQRRLDATDTCEDSPQPYISDSDEAEEIPNRDGGEGGNSEKRDDTEIWADGKEDEDSGDDSLLAGLDENSSHQRNIRCVLDTFGEFMTSPTASTGAVPPALSRAVVALAQQREANNPSLHENKFGDLFATLVHLAECAEAREKMQGVALMFAKP